MTLTRPLTYYIAQAATLAAFQLQDLILKIRTAQAALFRQPLPLSLHQAAICHRLVGGQKSMSMKLLLKAQMSGSDTDIMVRSIIFLIPNR